jgi:hypothetical protein
VVSQMHTTSILDFSFVVPSTKRVCGKTKRILIVTVVLFAYRRMEPLCCATGKTGAVARHDRRCPFHPNAPNPVRAMFPAGWMSNEIIGPNSLLRWRHPRTRSFLVREAAISRLLPE